MNALRGLAACSVVLSHFVEFNDFISNGWLKYVAHFGRYGVDVFFVISGFVIPYALDQQAFNIRRDWLTFLTRRTIRLEPPYLFAAVVSTLYLYGTQQMPWYHGAIREHCGPISCSTRSTSFPGLTVNGPILCSGRLPSSFSIISSQSALLRFCCRHGGGTNAHVSQRWRSWRCP
jgi:hypothetical protein